MLLIPEFTAKRNFTSGMYLGCDPVELRKSGNPDAVLHAVLALIRRVRLLDLVNENIEWQGLVFKASNEVKNKSSSCLIIFLFAPATMIFPLARRSVANLASSALSFLGSWL